MSSQGGISFSMAGNSRNNSMESSRLSLSPNDRLVLASLSSEGRNGLSSPKKSILENGNHESQRKASRMSEKEMNSLVHNALIRARQATKSFSPRSPSRQSMSPKSADATSPLSPNKGRPPVYSPSASSNPSPSRASAYSMSSSQSKKAISIPTLNHSNSGPNEAASKFQSASHLETSGSTDKFHTPISALIEKTSQLSKQSSLYANFESTASSAADQSPSSVGSTNSSDDIIKRVEEEIANARKAAREATRRLAGVSANFMAGVDSEGPNSTLVQTIGSSKKFDAQLKISTSGTSIGSSATDEDENFDSALDVIGEEFDDIVDGDGGEATDENKEYYANVYVGPALSDESLAFDEKMYQANIEAENVKQSTENRYVPADESNASMAHSSIDAKNDEIIADSELVNVIRIIEPSDLQELEAVLSDEREQDSNETNEEASSSENIPDGEEVHLEKDTSKSDSDNQATSVDETVVKNHDQLKMNAELMMNDSLMVTQETAGDGKASLESDKTADYIENFIDQSGKNEELADIDSGEKLDQQESLVILQNQYNEKAQDEGLCEDSRDQTSISPKVSRSFSKDTANLEALSIAEDGDKNMSNNVDTVETEEAVEEMSVNPSGANLSRDDSQTEAELQNEEYLVGATQKVNPQQVNDADNTESISEDIGEETNTKKSVSHDDMANYEQNLDDQATQVTDNKNDLASQLIDNLSIEGEENKPPNDMKTPLTPTSASGKILPSKKPTFSSETPNVAVNVENTVTTGPGKRVTFKQRYPIPQKMKKLRQPAEIMFDYQLERPSDKLWISMPKKDLKELLEAVTGSSIQRRSNACGALKVLSTQKKNQLTLVRTQGFMDALAFAISQKIYLKKYMEAGTAARTRAVNVVLNVAAQKDNRYHILLHTGLRESIVDCIMEDKAEARELGCAVLATLAKSQHCRDIMVKTENLVENLAIVMRRDDRFMSEDDNQTYMDAEKIDYSGDDELSRANSNTYSSSSSFSSTRTSFEDFSVGSLKEETLEMTNRTRMNACAALLHLSKECIVSQELCASDTLLSSLVSCSKEFQNPMHTKCLEILGNISRFPHNNARLVEYPGLIDAIFMNGSQENVTDRLWSMRIFQNLTCVSSAKARLATSDILKLLSTSMMRKQYGEQLAATSAVYNISTEPGAVVPLTNTKNVVATLVHVAHNPGSDMELRTIACDALATIGLWLQTLASSGTVPEGTKAIPLPSNITSGWQRWEE